MMTKHFKKWPCCLIPISVFGGVMIASPLAFAGWGKKIESNKCPVLVTAAIAKFGGHLDEIRLKDVDGEKLYRVEIERPKDKDVELYLTADGKIKRQIDEVTLLDVPTAVKDAAKKRMPNGTDIDDVSVETVDGKKIYIVEIDRKSAPDLHLHFAEDGAFIEEIEETDD